MCDGINVLNRLSSHEYEEWKKKLEVTKYSPSIFAEERESILQEAQRIVYGEREESYGHPSIDFTRTAKLWSIILDHEVTPKQASLCMIALKLSREIHEHKRDNLVDLAGYAAVADRIANE